MPPILKYLGMLFGALTLTKIVTLGFTVAHSTETDQYVVLAAVIAGTGLVFLLGLLACLFKRRWNSLTLLHVVVPSIAICQFSFFIFGWITPFEEAVPFLKFQQILDWLEFFTCLVFAVVLGLQTTKLWYLSKP